MAQSPSVLLQRHLWVCLYHGESRFNGSIAISPLATRHGSRQKDTPMNRFNGSIAISPLATPVGIPLTTAADMVSMAQSPSVLLQRACANRPSMARGCFNGSIAISPLATTPANHHGPSFRGFNGSIAISPLATLSGWVRLGVLACFNGSIAISPLATKPVHRSRLEKSLQFQWLNRHQSSCNRVPPAG